MTYRTQTHDSYVWRLNALGVAAEIKIIVELDDGGVIGATYDDEPLMLTREEERRIETEYDDQLTEAAHEGRDRRASERSELRSGR